MNDENRKLAQEIIAALKDIKLPNNKNIWITTSNEGIKINISEYIYG